jgi:sugar transferase (PEP-CTERM/EpsH1 system associated)
LFRSPELHHLIRAWTEETRFDAVVFYCSSMAQYLSAPGLNGVRVVGDLVDVDSQKWLDYAARSISLKRFLFALEGRRPRRLESTLPQHAAALALTTEAEAALFRSFCPTDRLHVVPNGVDHDHFHPLPTPAASGQRCTFVGALDYQANIDGITWFCREIWPEIRRRRPAATFTLVGSNPGPAVRRIARQPGVTLAASVPDVRPYLSDAAVVVVPLRIARGIQNKILEALAMAKAVVATPQALEGIDVEPGVHVCAAMTVSQWIETTVALLDDPARRDRLGQAGLAYVEENHQWRTSMIHFSHLLGLADPRAIASTAEPVRAAGKPVGETL